MIGIITLLFAAAGATAAVCAWPVAVSLIGFKAGGIAVGSYAAGMMSSMSVGGTTVAGGLVATLQSIGATGTVLGSTAATAAVGTAGSAIGIITRPIIKLFW